MALFRKGPQAAIAAGLLAVVAAAAAGPYLFTVLDSRDPTVSEVAAAAQGPSQLSAAQATTRTIDGIGFPDWTHWGWKAVDGRTDVFADDRTGATVRYRKGTDTIAYTVVEGTGDVDDGVPVRGVYRTPPEGKVELILSGLAGGVQWPPDCPPAREKSRKCPEGHIISVAAHTVKRKIRERSVILTAWPISDELSAEVQDMALRTTR